MPGRHIAVRDTELVYLSVKPEYLEFLIKKGLDRTPVVAPLMVMIKLQLILYFDVYYNYHLLNSEIF